MLLRAFGSYLIAVCPRNELTLDPGQPAVRMPPRIFREACAGGLPRGCGRLGESYLAGEGTTKDPAKAVPQFQMTGVEYGTALEKGVRDKTETHSPSEMFAGIGRDVAAVLRRAVGSAAIGEFAPEQSLVHRGRLTQARGPAPAPRFNSAAGPHGAPRVPSAPVCSPRAAAGQRIGGRSSRSRSP